MWLLNHTACIGNCTIALFKFYFLLYSYYTCFLALLLFLALLRYQHRSNSDTSVLIPCSVVCRVAMPSVIFCDCCFSSLFYPIEMNGGTFAYCDLKSPYVYISDWLSEIFLNLKWKMIYFPFQPCHSSTYLAVIRYVLVCDKPSTEQYKDNFWTKASAKMTK